MEKCVGAIDIFHNWSENISNKCKESTKYEISLKDTQRHITCYTAVWSGECLAKGGQTNSTYCIHEDGHENGGHLGHLKHSVMREVGLYFAKDACENFSGGLLYSKNYCLGGNNLINKMTEEVNIPFDNGADAHRQIIYFVLTLIIAFLLYFSNKYRIMKNKRSKNSNGGNVNIELPTTRSILETMQDKERTSLIN